MIEIKNKIECCGCHACYNVCPKNAIIMKEDEKGFKYPVVDKIKCINCGLCENVCPILNRNDEIEKDTQVYACYNKYEEERINSSSGGIFVLIAKEIIKQGGVVFGACLNENFNVVHTYTETEEDLKKFMGSKYVQSIIGNTYKKVKKFLDEGRLVLFTGTPCQIEGVKNYLQKDYKNLYTQDFICHGVPSPNVWKKYLDYQKKNNSENIKSVSFRNKDHTWSLYRIKILFDTKQYSKEHGQDMFMKAFLNDICLRDSCYNCSFKKKYRNSDITLADYWGIDQIHPEMNDNKGVSLVVVNSQKGKELFKCIKNNLNYKETNLDDAIRFNPSMIKSVNKPSTREKFFKQLDEDIEFNVLVEKNIPKKTVLRRVLSKCKSIVKKVLKRVSRIVE